MAEIKNKKLTTFFIALCFISLFVVSTTHIAHTQSCQQVYEEDGTPMLKSDGSPVCLSDTTIYPISEDCSQVYNLDETPILTYPQGLPSFNPAPSHYCPEDANVDDEYVPVLQYFDDLVKNPLDLPVAGLPYNIPSPGYLPPGGGLCGNGYLDPGEECDFGPNESENVSAYNTETGQLHEDQNGNPIIIIGNDDSIPNWCRSSCVLPYFGDGVVDFNFGEEEGPSGQEVFIGNDPQWLAEAQLFRDDPEGYFAQFVNDGNEDFPGPDGPEIIDPTDPTLVCDLEDHMCRPAAEATNPSGTPCTDHSDCGFLGCQGITCQRVQAGTSTIPCSTATALENCAFQGCVDLSCTYVPIGDSAEPCNTGKDEECWGKTCSKRERACIPVKIKPGDSTCNDDSNCPEPNRDNYKSGTPGTSPEREDAEGPVPDPPAPGCSPESVCEAGQCQNWCEINLNGACTGDMQDWCLHEENQCNLECLEVTPSYEHWATNYDVIRIEYGIKLPTLGQHVGSGVRISKWVAVNRFDKTILCDSEEPGTDQTAFNSSIIRNFYNHGRTLNFNNKRLLYEWSFDGPACVEPSGQGYTLHYWTIDGLDGNMGTIPRCILDNIGTTDCNANWEDNFEIAITTRACEEALKDADFFCDRLCASDGYNLPYAEITKRAEEWVNSLAMVVLRVPSADAAQISGANPGDPSLSLSSASRLHNKLEYKPSNSEEG